MDTRLFEANGWLPCEVQDPPIVPTSPVVDMEAKGLDINARRVEGRLA